ncbi:hypothetical protein FACS1894167_03880 [Synergistales bacterium]|nr:hypothetical protein FACS1894167_03880 [Synergistales bacterium]
MDTSELMRVFGELKTNAATPQQQESAAIPQGAAVTIAALRRELDEAIERERMANERERARIMV